MNGWHIIALSGRVMTSVMLMSHRVRRHRRRLGQGRHERGLGVLSSGMRLVMVVKGLVVLVGEMMVLWRRPQLLQRVVLRHHRSDVVQDLV